MGVFAYYDTDTDGIVYHVVPSPESEYAPSTFYSETDTTMSGSTIESDDIPGYFVVQNGRQRSASKNVAVWLPADNVRVCIVRFIFMRTAFGGHYVGPVRDILSPLKDRTRHVLEVGTKSGTWIQAMATEFPHVQFCTVDSVPMIAHAPRHNVTFEVYDFTQGFLLDDASQDVVFLNFVLEVKNYRALLREVHRILRPGGLIHIADFNPRLWELDNLTVPVERPGSQACRNTRIVVQGLMNAGIDPDTCDKLPQWLAPESDVWNGGQRGFRDINSHMRVWPFFPHDGHSCMNLINPSLAPYTRNFFSTNMRDMVGLVQYSGGLTREEAEKLAEDAIEELKQPENCYVWKMYSIYAIKA